MIQWHNDSMADDSMADDSMADDSMADDSMIQSFVSFPSHPLKSQIRNSPSANEFSQEHRVDEPA